MKAPRLDRQPGQTAAAHGALDRVRSLRALLLAGGLLLGITCLFRPLAAEVRYRVVDLTSNAPVQIGSSGGWGINQHGDVVGYYSPPGGSEGKVFVYRDGIGIIDLADLPGGSGFPHGINDQGQVALNAIAPGGQDHAGPYRYTPGIGYEYLGSLGPPGETYKAYAMGINNLGQVVGSGGLSSGGQNAFLYTDGVGIQDLGNLGANSTADDINDLGWVAGDAGAHVIIWTKETGMVPIAEGGGYAINNRGVVAGVVGCCTFELEAAIFENGRTRRLGSLGGDSWAEDINDYNVVVGQSAHSQFLPTTDSGFIWTEAEGMLDLRALVPTNWWITWPKGINNRGQIAAAAAGPGVAVRLDPIPPTLTVQRVGTNVVVSWSPAWPGLVLESTPDLAEPAWQPLYTGGTNVVTVLDNIARRFFRLNLEGARGLCWGP